MTAIFPQPRKNVGRQRRKAVYSPGLQWAVFLEQWWVYAWWVKWDLLKAACHFLSAPFPIAQPYLRQWFLFWGSAFGCCYRNMFSQIPRTALTNSNTYITSCYIGWLWVQFSIWRLVHNDTSPFWLSPPLLCWGEVATECWCCSISMAVCWAFIKGGSSSC